MNEVCALLLSCVWCASLHTSTSFFTLTHPVTCYECSTERHEYQCADPFNQTDDIKTKLCTAGCAKLLKKPKIGPSDVIRTCAETLDIQMHWGFVCMKESRPGDGKLCFCDDDYCNQSSTWHKHGYSQWLLYISVVAMTWTLTHTLTTGCGLCLNSLKPDNVPTQNRCTIDVNQTFVGTHNQTRTLRVSRLHNPIS